jgi:hypothetical protein
MSDMCERVTDQEAGFACARKATEVVTVQDKMLGLVFDVHVCEKHGAEYRERSAHARTSRKRTTSKN